MAQGNAARRFRVDRAPATSQRAFAEHIQPLWLTPAMDGLFTGPAGDRRRFLDRLTLGVDADHGARVSKLERALRNRNRLLEDGGADPRWLAAAEQEIAALGVAVASARLDTARRLAALIEATRDDASPFPFALIALDGDLEQMLRDEPAFTVEERYRSMLAGSRRRDAAAGTHADRPARQRSIGAARPQGRGRARLLDWRTESAARRSRVGPCAPRDRHARHGPPRFCWTRSPRISTRADAKPCSTNWTSSAVRSG